MIPVTNSGTTASESPPMVMIRSVSRSRFSAAIDAADDGERNDHDEREGGELERVHERRPDQLAHGEAVGERRPEVAVEEPRDPVPVL